MSVLRADAPFFWPLRGSLALQNGSGSPTFTRATAAWGFNETGKLYKVPSGAVRMRGYRPVINQYSGNTDNMSGLSTARITLIDSATSDADGTSKAGTWRLDATAGEHYLRTQSSSYEGKDVNIAFKIKLTSYRYVALRIGSWYNFYNLQTQSWNGALQGSSRDAVVSGDWVLLEMTGGPVPSGSPAFSLLFTSAALGASWTPLGTEEVIVYQAMMSDVTGDTDKTFSDYVAGDTSYGAGANGVKYYATYKDGTAIPEANLLGARINPNAITNTLLYCRDLLSGAIAGKWIPSATGSEIVTNGTPGADTSGWNAFDANLSILSGALQVQTIVDYGFALQALSGLTVGKCYLVSVDFIKSGGNSYISIVPNSDGSGAVTAGLVMTASGTASFVFVAATTTTYLRLQVNTAAANDTAQFKNISVKEAGVQIALNQTGLDGLTNGATLLTANTSNATILQTITAAASAGCFGYYVRRVTGIGRVYLTRDGGSTVTDITNLINNSTLTFVKIENSSVLNPQCGFVFETSGDQIHVDAGINHLGTQLSETPVITTSASVTVNADTLTSSTSGNFSDFAGTVIATVTRDDWTVANGSAVGSSACGLYTSSANSGAQGLDGTNTVNGPTGTPSGSMKIGLRWSGTSLQVYSNGSLGNAGSYDGGFNLSSIALAAGVQCTIKDVAIWHTSLSDTEMIAAANNI